MGLPRLDFKTMGFKDPQMAAYLKQIVDVLTGALTGVIKFINLEFTGSNLTSLATKNHNDLDNKQGGTTNEFYHMTSAQNTMVVDIVDTAASKLIGRGSAAGSGAAQEISLGTGLAMTGTTLSAAGSGDVVGPAGATDGNVAVFDTATGKKIKDGGTLGTAAFQASTAFDASGAAAAVAGDLTTHANLTSTAHGGIVNGPGSATNGNVVLFNGTTGKLIKDGGTLGTAAFVSSVYDVGGGYVGRPLENAFLLRYPFPRAASFAVGLSPSQGVAGTAATAQTDFDLLKNGVSFGTMRFAASATTATFIAASPVSFVAGDILTVVAPATRDASLADIGFVISGTR